MAWGAILRGVGAVAGRAAAGAGRVAAGAGTSAARAARVAGASRMAAAQAGARAGGKAFARQFQKRAMVHGYRAIQKASLRAAEHGPKYAERMIKELDRARKEANEAANAELGEEQRFQSGVAAEEIYREEIQAQIQKMKLISSSDLYNSVWAQYGVSSEAVLTTSSGYSVGSTPYAKFVEYGRRAGKMPPVEAIYKWMQDKGYNPTMQDAYAVAKHIALNGTAAKNPFAIGVKMAEVRIRAQQTTGR